MDMSNNKTAVDEYAKRLLGRDVLVLEGAYSGLTGQAKKIYLDEDGQVVVDVYLTLPKNDEPPERRELDYRVQSGVIDAIIRSAKAYRAYDDDPQPLKSIWVKGETQPDGTRRFFAMRQARGDDITVSLDAEQVEPIK